MATTLKINEKNRLFNEISVLEKFNERIEKGRNELMSIPDKDYVKKITSENDLKVSENEQKIKEMKERIQKIDSGELDEELNSLAGEIKTKTDMEYQKFVQHNEKKIKNAKEIKEKVNRLYKTERSERYNEKCKLRDMEWALNRYNSITIPDYMVKKIRKYAIK
jgi:ABC-type proline/glycine betaine transport system ATPase subunit